MSSWRKYNGMLYLIVYLMKRLTHDIDNQIQSHNVFFVGFQILTAKTEFWYVICDRKMDLHNISYKK